MNLEEGKQRSTRGIQKVYRRNSFVKFYNRFSGLKLSNLRSWVLGGELIGAKLKVLVEE